MAIEEETRVWLAGILHCDQDKLNEDAGVGKTPGWDSLGHLNVMMELDRQYGIEINDETVRKFQEIGAIEQVVANKEKI